MSAVDVLAVMDAYSVPGQICCGMPMGGGCDENGNMETPICCGQPFTESDMQAARAAVAELIEAAERADKLLHLLTVRKVIEAGYDAIDASGLNPYCMNEGLAEGHESIAPRWLASAIRRCKGEQA